MKKFICAALAAIAATAPAAAQDRGWYAGLEAGLLWPQDATVSATENGGPEYDYVDIDYRSGFDGDLIAGYDFGMFRLEGELGYKRARHDDYEVAFGDTEITDGLVGPLNVVNGFDVDSDNGSTRVWSLMLNALLDVNATDRLAFYGGVGLGYHSTRVKIDFETLQIGQGSIHDSGLAWQLIAGARYAISDHVDLGLKYRYFRTDRLKDDDFEDEYDVETRFKSHSLLASLIYNFGAPAAIMPPPPPPPPPMAPPAATQTCYDGSVILATDICPSPPPPPPPAAPERG